MLHAMELELYHFVTCLPIFNRVCLGFVDETRLKEFVMAALLIRSSLDTYSGSQKYLNLKNATYRVIR